MSIVAETCPNCKGNELDSGGVCRICGTKVRGQGSQAGTPAPIREIGGFSGLIPMDITGAGENAEGAVPEWRQELSKRLHEIRRKRGLEPADAPILPFPALEQPAVASAASGGSSHSAGKAAPPKPAPRRSRPAPRVVDKSAIRPARPPRKLEESLPLFKSDKKEPGPIAERRADSVGPVAAIADPEPDQIQKLIDSILARQGGQLPGMKGPAGPETAPSRPHEDKLILLSRTLSGLVDLLIVLFSTGAFIVAADIFSGIEDVDNISKIYYAALLLATYFVYSVFFLGTANQTIGMMIKDLRIVGLDGERPGFRSVAARCAAYLVSWGSLGIGFIWGLFDRQSMCLHDKLSNTRVVRL